MSDRAVELQAILTNVRRRWTGRSLLRAWTLGSAVAAGVLLAGISATYLVAADGLPLLVAASLTLLIAVAALGRALWPCRRTPTDRQLARLIEERNPDLDDVVVTAVDCAARPDLSPVMVEALASDAARALQSLDRDAVVPRRTIRRAAVGAAAATAALAMAGTLFVPGVSRATRVATAYLFPARLQIDVSPGTARVREGQPLTITARVAGLTGEIVPQLTVAVGADARTVTMQATGEPDLFAVTIERVSASFAYHVRAAKSRSGDYTVTAMRPARVERIDLHYEFPRGLGLPPRTDEDSGDIYGPAGTRVRVTVHADKPIAAGALVLSDGTRIALDGQPLAVDGALTIDGDASYRVALEDHDGLASADDTEYFIRTLDDRPPDVRILRPASDKQVTPLEEVVIEARADDDYGIASFELVFQTVAGQERAVALRGARSGLSVAGLHTLFMEDLGVQPGDFVTYYARATDVSRGRRSTEARSDIFFLEVKPFEEEFVAAASQTMGQGAGAQADGLAGLAAAQKDVIVATWKLDARARRARDARSREDIGAVSKAQSDLRARVEKAGAQASRLGIDARRRRGAPGAAPEAAPGADPLGRAVEAMGRAVHELDQADTGKALPHEMEALNQLLKAEAENRRRQISRQQQAGAGGGANRPEADLSNLFDQELRRRQETNYETPNSTEARDEPPQEDPLERIRELARRQDAINRQQREMTRNREQMSEAELKRQLERLTRDQNELRQQAEQLSQRMQQGGSQQSSQGGRSSSELREISEAMRNAASGLRRQDSAQASANGERAAERLRDLEKGMQASRPDDRRRALGDLQLETRQLADAQRRLATEAGRTAKDQRGDDARRRLAGDQERLAERAARLEESVTRLARSGQGESGERAATGDAARELERQKLAERMRESADSLRQPAGTEGPAETPTPPDPSSRAAREGADLARVLDRVAERLGAATGAQDADTRRLSDNLSKTQELRDKVAGLERSIEEMRREAQQPAQGRGGGEQEGSADGQPPSPGPDPQAPRQGPQQAQGGQPSASAPGGQQSSAGRDGASGQQGTGPGGNGGRLQQLQREVNERARDVERLAQEVRRDNPGMQGGNSEDGWWRSTSAPGTEAFKQDFARWESLKDNLLVALEQVESRVSDELRARENDRRLNAGGHDGVSDAYRDLVDRYYRSLAAPRKPK